VVVVLILGERGDVYGPTFAAIAARGMFPSPGVVGDAVPAPAPLHAVRVRQRSCRRRRHAPCLAAPGVPLRYRLPACAATVTGRASSSLRSGTSRASCSVVGDVERPRCSDALGDLVASRLVRSPVPTPASGLCHAACLSSKTRTATRHALRLFPRATVIGNAVGCHTRYEDPGPSHLLLEEKSNKCARAIRLREWGGNEMT
jgi:hypothetical protein